MFDRRRKGGLGAAVAAALALAVLGTSSAIAHDGDHAKDHRQKRAAGHRAWGYGDAIDLGAIISGANEVGIAGNLAAGGTVRLSLDPTSGAVSFRVVELHSTLGPGEATPLNLHIHRGKAGENGPVVVDFTAEAADGTGTVTADPDLVAEIVDNPSGFYVNLHTVAFPKGAIRGQLDTAPRTRISALIAGTAEVGSPGDLDGTAKVELAVSPRTGIISFRAYDLQNLLAAGERPTKLHIHRGSAGANGPVVADFGAFLAKGRTFGVIRADPALLWELARYPERFYANMHTAAFPDGAARGQLGWTRVAQTTAHGDRRY